MIQLRGVRVHNLQDVDLDLPDHQLIAICGRSGAGKTSLAIDTLYAEGQRRYVETFSPYARQFLEQLGKPDADSIAGLPLAVCVSRMHAGRSNRVTVGTATEVYEYLRVLYAQVGQVVCTGCGHVVESQTTDTIARAILGLSGETTILLCYTDEREPDESPADWLSRLRESGYSRGIVGDRMLRLDDSEELVRGQDSIEIAVDRFRGRGISEERLRDSLETTLSAGKSRCTVYVEGGATGDGGQCVASPLTIDGRDWTRLCYSTTLRCSACDIDYLEPQPMLLSFNHSFGACPRCEGLGGTREVGHLQTYRRCRACGGSRLRPEAVAIRVAGATIAEIHSLTAYQALEWFRSLPEEISSSSALRETGNQIRDRLEHLIETGAGYLTLDRTHPTLSGGERQRVAMTAALGSILVNTLYVLDEPSAGLHPHDVPRMVGAVKRIRDRGNTVVAVDHQAELIRAADHVVEMGPGAGQEGGRIVFEGTPAELERDEQSETGGWLSGRRGFSGHGQPRRDPSGWLRLSGAAGNNLQNLEVEFPLGVMCLVTGVSGAGKSTLVMETLLPALQQQLGIDAEPPARFASLLGAGQIEFVEKLDQTRIARSGRSNPVTYVKAFDPIRAAFAETSDARTRNFSPGTFSFNVEGGRCERCRGEGLLDIDMQFLPEIHMPCPECQGRRYRKEVLAVRYRNQSIADVLDLTVREAMSFFRGQQKIQSRLQVLSDVGLSYLQLGQPIRTLSSGETQRLKLAGVIAARKRGRTLLVMDEPTTGLHFSDVLQLIDCFESLLSVGHSLIIIEHNLQLMRAADYLIDLGPGAGDAGGRCVATGTPEELARRDESLTGKYLAAYLKQFQ